MSYSCFGVRRSLLGLIAPVALGATLALTPAIARAEEPAVAAAQGPEVVATSQATESAPSDSVVGEAPAAVTGASEADSFVAAPAVGASETAAKPEDAPTPVEEGKGDEPKQIVSDDAQASAATPSPSSEDASNAGDPATVDASANPAGDETAKETAGEPATDGAAADKKAAEAVAPATAADASASDAKASAAKPDVGDQLAKGIATASSPDGARSPLKLSKLAVEKQPAKAQEADAKAKTEPAPKKAAESAQKKEEEEASKPAVKYANMYRLYNPNSGEHFYTSALGEARHLFELGWRWEGVGWVAPETSKAPVYRLYNPNAGDHHYTTNKGERDQLVRLGWRSEGIGWYSDLDKDSVSVWRQYNPNARSGAHNFTTSTVEKDHLVKVGWRDEKIAWNASNQDVRAIKGFWAVSSAWGSRERYWVGADADIARSRFVTPSEGAGYYAYAKSDGKISRGKVKVGSKVLLSNNEGKLTTQTSWLITKVYDGGNQRYYLAKDTGDGYSYAKTGFFKAALEGTTTQLWFFGHPSQGYVTRGAYRASNGVIVSDYVNGSLAENYEKPGMVVSKRYDGQPQRYYLEKAKDGHLYARVGKFKVGKTDYYGREDTGYVVRGYYINPKGEAYFGDNDGKLTSGWLSAAGLRAWRRIANYGSATQYILVVDSDACKTFVFQGSAGRWVPRFEWLAGVGLTKYNNGNGTPKSEYYTLGGDNASYNASGNGEWRRYYYEKDDLYYFSGFVLDCGFHSTIPSLGPAENQVGRKISHGCVRLLIQNAKWIYDNCARGTRVVSY
ncbi:L,D-transpeptidase family protein [uncultured Olsenella sp.]|uniref:L,D-transpeptidase family protein n=1 Tax=uncultured Olsenella sp. TaxID=190764 RepID=UPI0026DB1071|nr:L,D-transpeptidase family protein [uncultured Olsenella sp.]